MPPCPGHPCIYTYGCLSSLQAWAACALVHGAQANTHDEAGATPPPSTLASPPAASPMSLASFSRLLRGMFCWRTQGVRIVWIGSGRGRGSLHVTTSTAETGPHPVTLSHQLPQQPHPQLSVQESKWLSPVTLRWWWSWKFRLKSDSIEKKQNQSSRTMPFPAPGPTPILLLFLSLIQQVFKLSVTRRGRILPVSVIMVLWSFRTSLERIWWTHAANSPGSPGGPRFMSHRSWVTTWFLPSFETH